MDEREQGNTAWAEKFLFWGCLQGSVTASTYFPQVLVSLFCKLKSSKLLCFVIANTEVQALNPCRRVQMRDLF